MNNPGVTATLGLSPDAPTAPAGDSGAPAGNPGATAGIAGVASATDASSGAAMIAVKRLCPQILMSPGAYDDGLVLLCRRAARL